MEMYVVEGSDLPDINDRRIVVLSVSKREVTGKIYNRALRVVSQLENFGTDARGHLAITFEYDDIPEEIFEIAEIRDWVAGLLERVPHLFYFITRFSNNQQSIAACLADLEAIKPMPSMTYDQIMRHVFEHGKVPEFLLNIRMPKRLCNLIFKSSLAYACRVNDNLLEVAEVILKIPSLLHGLDQEMLPNSQHQGEGE